MFESAPRQPLLALALFAVACADAGSQEFGGRAGAEGSGVAGAAAAATGGTGMGGGAGDSPAHAGAGAAIYGGAGGIGGASSVGGGIGVGPCTGATTTAPNFRDRIDFGNGASELSHAFDPGASTHAPMGNGGLGLSYRAPLGVAGTDHPYNGAAGVQMPQDQAEQLTFSLACDPVLQNYLTIKLWGSDAQQADIQLLGAAANTDAFLNHSSGGPPPFPGRFFFVTEAIPLSLTLGKASVQLGLFESNANPVGQPTVPIYSAFSHTNPYFVPDSKDATGSAPVLSGQKTISGLSSAQVNALLLSNRQAIYGSTGYSAQVLARQITPGTAGAPKETIGLDLWTSIASFNGATKTADQWRDQIGGGQHGPGYATFPDELLSVLYASYLLPALTDSTGKAIVGLDHDHDATLLQRIVWALDGASYLQAGDGRFNRDAGKDSAGVDASSVWQGLTSTPRAAGHAYAGSSARGGSWTLSLEGVDTQTLGLTIIRLLTDPKLPEAGSQAAPRNFLDYLAGSFDADLNGQSMLRASAYERMLSEHVSYLQIAKGGTISQNLFQELGMYAAFVALELLEQRFPNPTYAPSSSVSLDFMAQSIGLSATTLSNPNASGIPNLALSQAGFGEAHGTLSGGYDGRYGQILPWLVPTFARIATVDPSLASNPTRVAETAAQARHTIDGYAQFIAGQEKFNSADGTSSFTFAQEDYITYRNSYGPNANAGGFNVDVQYEASDPQGEIADAYALRAAFLAALYGKTPGTGAAGTASLNYLRSLAAYEHTLQALADRDPASLTPLPAEPGQPDFAFADVELGVVAFVNHGERFYLNANWRNFELNQNKLGKVSNLARIHDTTSVVDRAALIVMPHDSASVQSDGNLSGDLQKPWFVRYGDYLIAFNNSVESSSVKLPSGSGSVEDLLGKACHDYSSELTLAPGSAAILWLNPRE